MEHGEGAICRALRRTVHQGHDGLMVNRLAAHEIPDSPCSSAWTVPASISLPGWRITTSHVRIQPLATRRRRPSPPNCISNGLLRYAVRAPLHRPLLHRAHAQQSCCPLIPAGGKLGVTSAAFTEGLRRILCSSVNPSCRTAVCSRIRSRGTIPSSGTLPQPA